jgi:hypothetical protein
LERAHYGHGSVPSALRVVSHPKTLARLGRLDISLSHRDNSSANLAAWPTKGLAKGWPCRQ